MQCLLHAAEIRGWHDPDGFYGRLAAKCAGVRTTTESDLLRTVKGVQTRFFEVNLISRPEFVRIMLPELSLALSGGWNDPQRDVHHRVVAEDVDSFSVIRTIPPQAVTHLVPVTLSEDDIQACMERILGEGSREKDWGGRAE